MNFILWGNFFILLGPREEYKESERDEIFCRSGAGERWMIEHRIDIEKCSLDGDDE